MFCLLSWQFQSRKSLTIWLTECLTEGLKPLWKNQNTGKTVLKESEFLWRNSSPKYKKNIYIFSHSMQAIHPCSFCDLRNKEYKLGADRYSLRYSSTGKSFQQNSSPGGLLGIMHPCQNRKSSWCWVFYMYFFFFFGQYSPKKQYPYPAGVEQFIDNSIYRDTSSCDALPLHLRQALMFEFSP